MELFSFIPADGFTSIVFEALTMIVTLLAPFVVFALIIHWFERITQQRLAERFGWRSVMFTGWLGTPIHELSHAAMCKLFGHRIDDIALFEPDRESGRLGYVGFWASWFRRFPREDVREAYRLLDRVGLMHMADKRADELSGGQRQRVGICRALIQNPEFLLVDEPTASLDPKTSRQIMRLINELCTERGLAAIINIHDVHLAQMYSQRIVGLKAGTIVFDGAPDRLAPDVLTEIYGEEDWEATIEDVDDEEEENEELQGKVDIA